ncbi:MAG TPA: prolipoprotein diacylglyceryl transferase [Deltaproteobacteria bacterium]|nr:prolipoprotein diacylglyceryl transferase [Deltaproteobacteria bacterium]HOI06049.1 prolipoprotein diacylglyceryl transferase [Deltaproteobacteria bacterium]
MEYPQIDPVFFQIGPLQFRWYGLMYIIGFACAFFIALNLIRRKGYDMSRPELEDLFTYAIAGLIIGARVGYCLFYNFSFYIHHPLKIFAVWEGGMSFHGGLIGLVLAGAVFAWRSGKPLLMLADMGALAATPGLFFGRMGNFINAELYGKVTDVSWGMVFPGGGPLPRHPSQLYEGFAEGLLLFVILYLMSRKVQTRGVLISCFLLLYGTMRFFLEFFREPDAHLGLFFGALSMGQILCLGMVAAGLALLAHVLKSRSVSSDNEQ